MRDTLIIKVTPLWYKSLTNVSALIDGQYVPARPMGFSSFRYRCKAAWLVFTGRADALLWPGGQ